MFRTTHAQAKFRAAGLHCLMSDPLTSATKKTGGVVWVTHRRGHCTPFWLIFPPLQVAPSFACSVASLSQSPDHQLSGCRSLRRGILTDYQLGWGKPSTWSTRLADAPSRSNTLFPQDDRRMDTPSEKIENQRTTIGKRLYTNANDYGETDDHLL